MPASSGMLEGTDASTCYTVGSCQSLSDKGVLACHRNMYKIYNGYKQCVYILKPLPSGEPVCAADTGIYVGMYTTEKVYCQTLNTSTKCK
jgi:hypothetical protein